MKFLKLSIYSFVLIFSISSASRADLVIDYTDGSPTFGWRLPMAQGTADAMAMRFTNTTAVECTLKTVSAGLIDDPDILTDTVGDLFFVIYAINVDGQFDTLIYFKTVPNADFAGEFNKPLNVVNMDVSALGLTFQPGEEWGVAVTTDPNSAAKGEVLTFASDSGAKPSLRWYEVPLGGNWQRANCCHGGIDVNMHIYSTISAPSVNRPPQFTSTVYDYQTDEGKFAAIPIEATDPDQDYVTLTLGNNTFPPDAYLEQIADNSGFAELKWLTDFTDAGFYSAEIIADDGNGGLATAVYSLTVNNVNQPPIFLQTGDFNVNEGGEVRFTVTATDIDDDPIILEVLNTNIPPGEYGFELFRSEASGEFTWQTDFADSGNYFVKFAALTNESSATDSVNITINNVLCADLTVPDFALSGPASVSKGISLSSRLLGSVTNSGETDSFDSVNVGLVLSTDQFLSKGDFILGIQRIGPVAKGAIVDVPIDGIIPPSVPDGQYYLGFITDIDDSLAECDETNNAQWVFVNVVLNNFPVLNPIADTSVDEGQYLEFSISGFDTDIEPFIFETNNLPNGSSFQDNGDGTATFSWYPGFDQAGIYNVTFRIVDDREGNDEQVVRITVNDLNQPPVLEPIGSRNVNENDTLSFFVNASDFDNDAISMEIVDSDLPNFDFKQVSTRTSFQTYEFTFAPTFDDAGPYTATFVAFDAGGADSEVVSIFVNNTNRPPALVEIGDFLRVEGDTITFPVIAFDPDFDFAALSIFETDLPATATFADSGVGAGVFNWPTTIGDAGSYYAIFRADDDNGGLDYDTVNFLITSANGAPILEPNADVQLSETDTLDLSISASDPDDDLIALTVFDTDVPSGSFVDNGNGTGTFHWQTTYNDEGTYFVIFSANDPSGAESRDTIQIFVMNRARPPVLDPIGNRSVNEDDTLQFTVSGFDPDDGSVTFKMTSADLPSGALFNDPDYGANTFYWNPTFDDSGTYSATFTIFDNDSLTDSETISILVDNVNRPPVLNPIDTQYFTEGNQNIFVIDASDPDDPIPTVTASNLPSGASLEYGDAPYVDWTPGFDQAGDYFVTFYATDDFDAVDSEVVLFRVFDVNQPPILQPVNDTAIAENQALHLDLSATDPDGGILSLIALNQPIGSGFIDNGNNTATFDWSPSFEQSGDYDVSFIATDGELADTVTVSIIVINANRPPVLDLIGPVTVYENDNFYFDVSGSDPDGDSLAFTSTALPEGAEYNQFTFGSARFSWIPNLTQAGSYFVTFYLSDGQDTDSELVEIRVLDLACTNLTIASFTLSGPQQISIDKEFQARLDLSLQNLGPLSITDSFTVSFLVSDSPSLDGQTELGLGSVTVPSLALGGPFEVNMNTGLFLEYDFSPGNYYLFAQIDQNQNYIDCNPSNNYASIPFEAVYSILPVLDPIGDKEVDEGNTLAFYITASDVDLDPLYYYYSATFLPGNPTLTRINSDSALFEMSPGFDDAGQYPVIFRADESDKGGYFDEELITITVNNVNRPPVLDPIGPQTFFVNQYREFDVTGTDPDNNDNFTFYTSARPEGAGFSTFTGLGPTYGRFSWQPTAAQVGNYEITFYMVDEFVTDSEVVTITVENVPCSDLSIESFTLDGPQQISRGRQFQSRLNLTLNNLGPLTADSQVVIEFYYSSPQWGVYLLGTQTVNSVGLGPVDVDITDPVSMDADAGIGPAYLLVSIGESGYLECNPQNNIDSIPFELVDNIFPVLDSIGAKPPIFEGETVAFGLNSSDADGDQLSYFYSSQPPLPGNVIFNDSGNGSAYFEWTPGLNDAGIYAVTFVVYDIYKSGGSSDQETVTITVRNLNRPPVLDPIGPQTFYENQFRQFNVSASDPDANDNLIFTSSALPLGAAFFNLGGSYVFSWLPDENQVGNYSVTFYVTDGIDTDSEIVEITVENVQCPDLSVEVFTLDGPQRISFDRSLQSRLNLEIQNSGEIGTSDDVAIEFFVSDDSSLNCDCNIEPIGFQLVDSMPVGGQFPLDIVEEVSLYSQGSISQGKRWLCAVIDRNDTYGDCNTSNNYVCIPIDVGYNIPPILDPIGDKEVDEGETLGFVVTATDWDFDNIYMDYYVNNNCECIYINFEDSGNGHAYFEWTPDFDQAGDYTFEFYAYDDYKSNDIETITIKVNNTDRAPIIDSLPDTLTYNEGQFIGFRVSASDPDGDCLELSLALTDLPPSANFDYVFDCVKYGDFNWTPGYGDAGIYHAVFQATDEGGAIGEDTVVLVINNINAPPQFDEISFYEIVENDNLDFTITATDIDGNLSSIYTEQLPVGASFVYNGNGAGSFNWVPDCSQSGEYSIRCFAADDSGLIDTSYINIYVDESCDLQLTVVTTPCVQCAPPQFYTDILVSDNSFPIVFNKYLEESSISENISLSTARGGLLDYYYDVKNKSIRVYPQYGEFFPIDTIYVTLSTGIYDLEESSLDSTYNLAYTTGPVVYPGDCNNDGIVNEVDVLSIGLFWNEEGPDRFVGGEYGPLEFFAQPAHFKEQGNGEWVPWNGVYADVDGSGVVDANDLCGIATNFEMTTDEERSSKGGGNLVQTAALGQVGSKVLEQMREALIECPESQPKTKLLEVIENALRASSPILPTEVVLNQNYPNPFNPSTTIEFYLPEASQAKLEVYNMLGQRVITLIDEKVEAGYKTIVWSGTDYSGKSVASGIYFYKLNTESKEIIKRMLLVK